MFTTVPGIEDIVVREITMKGFEVYSWYKIGITELSGRVIIESDDKILRYIRNFRTIEKAYLVIDEGTIPGRDLDSLSRLISSLNIDPIVEMFTPHMTFAIRSTRAGDHEFTSMDISRLFGDKLRSSVRDRLGFYPIVNLDNPDIIIELDVIGDRYVLAIEIIRRSLRHRSYRVFHHEATLNPPLAYAMNMLLGYDRYGKYLLLDPLCGSGTIIIEGLFHYVNSMYYGVEIYRHNCRGAIRNIYEAGVHDRACIVCSDSTRLSSFIRYCDGIVTNPPYGIRMKTIDDSLRKFYIKILGEFSKVLRDGGRIVMISPRRGLVEHAAHVNKLEIVDRREVEQGGMISTIYILSR